MTFEMLVVCTGNICRSPAAAQILASRLDPDVAVSSAGVDAVIGAAIHPVMADAMRRAGLEPRAHRARQVTEEVVSRSDLVLTMDTAQRGRVISLLPAALRRVFTLQEFALSCTSLSAMDEFPWPRRLSHGSRLLDLAERVSAYRGRTPAGAAMDIDDPYGGPAAGYDRCLHEIDSAVTQIMAAVEGRSGVSPEDHRQPRGEGRRNDPRRIAGR